MTKTRPYMPLRVQRDAALIALGLDPKTVEFHHDPPLGVRPFKVVNGKRIYTPAANDPQHITPLGKAAHQERYSRDRFEVDKTRRAGEKEEAFRRRLLSKTRESTTNDEALNRESTTEGKPNKERAPENGSEPRSRRAPKTLKRKIPSRPFPKQKRPMRRKPN